VVDLTVDEDDRLDSGIPNALPRMRFRKILELSSNVGRCVEKDPTQTV